MNYRWIILIAIVVVGIILLDEIAYQTWISQNPGANWSGVRGINSPLVDPNNPPTRYYGGR